MYTEVNQNIRRYIMIEYGEVLGEYNEIGFGDPKVIMIPNDTIVDDFSFTAEHKAELISASHRILGSYCTNTSSFSKLSIGSPSTESVLYVGVFDLIHEHNCRPFKIYKNTYDITVMILTDKPTELAGILPLNNYYCRMAVLEGLWSGLIASISAGFVIEVIHLAEYKEAEVIIIEPGLTVPAPLTEYCNDHGIQLITYPHELSTEVYLEQLLVKTAPCVKRLEVGW